LSSSTRAGGCSDAILPGHRLGEKSRESDKQSVYPFPDDTERRGECTMTNALVEWFRGKNAEDSLSYDFTEAHPVWKTWWFWSGIVVVCIVLIWILQAA